MRDPATDTNSAVGAAAAAEVGSTSASSPLTLSLASRLVISPAMSAVSGFEGAGVCGEFKEIVVEARDASGFPLNTGGSAFTLTADNELAQMKRNLDNRDGTYTLSFTSVRSGTKQMRLYKTTRSNSPVVSDWTVFVGGPTVWPKSVVFYPAPTIARLSTVAWMSGGGSSTSYTSEAGAAAIAVITARDRYGNEQLYGRHYRSDLFTATASMAAGNAGENSVDAVMSVSPGKDRYHAAITALTVGSYDVRIKFDGQDIEVNLAC